MTKHAFTITFSTPKATMYFLFLFITLQLANSARILDEVDPLPAITTMPSGQLFTIPPTDVVEDADQSLPDDDDDVDEPDTVVPPIADVTPLVAPVAPLVPPIPDVAPLVTPVTTVAPSGPAVTAISPVAPITGPGPVSTIVPSGPLPTAATGANPEHPPLSFFMHDILGGTQPSTRVVTGIIASSAVNGLPFSKPNGQVFPINGGVPLPNNINGIVNNNNVPFLTGLNTGSQATTILQNNGNNNVVVGNNQPFVTGGQLPTGVTLQQLMFGTVTVIDDELTEGHELGSAVIGKAQGFYLASSLDGTSQTMALTAIFHSGDHHDGDEDTVSFFGVHRTASLESQIAVVGGTGKYESAQGYATIGAIHMEDEHTTDGVDTILQINVYLSH